MLALNVKNLEKTYANGTRALDGVSLSVEEGDFFALLGPNGAGKSTLIGIISSLVNPTAGDVEIFGISVEQQRALAMCQLGPVPQEINFNWFEKPLDIVVNQAGYYGIPRAKAYQRAEELLEKLKLWDKRSVIARTLSGSMKRRLMIARAMVHQPRLLILDEPTAGVDIEIRRAMWEFIKEINEQGTTVILTTHYLEEAEELCRNIAIIDQGRIVENTSVRELLTRLDMETFVLDLDKELDGAPQIDGYTTRLRDANCIEVEVPKSRALNRVFDHLNEQDLRVMSMRNKSNRLEELFMRLVEKPNE